MKISVLPQVSPTSAVFSNIVCHKLDRRLSGIAKRFHLNYTRYADDISFSSMHNVYQENDDFIKEVQKVIKDQNFDIKESKTRLQKTGFRQDFTGLIINKKVNVRKRYTKQIRICLYYWEKYGYNKAEAIFLRDYFIDKGHAKKVKPNFQNVLSGKFEYVKMVKGFENATHVSVKKSK
jgi:RNA-directed DNA polymerase